MSDIPAIAFYSLPKETMHCLVVPHNVHMWPGQGKSTMYMQELESLLLKKFIATLVHYPDTTIE